MILKLDDLDYEAVQRCIAKRQSFRCWPGAASDFRGDMTMDEEMEALKTSDPLSDGSNIAGLALAEICRGWEEMLEASQ